jgi:hypothetical protein
MYDQTGNGRLAQQTTTSLQLELTFNAPGSYPCVKNSTSTRDYLTISVANPCSAVLTVYNITGGDQGAGLISHSGSENPSIRNIFGAIGEWDTFNFPTNRFVDDAAASVFSLATWHTSRFTRATNLVFPVSHVLFNSTPGLNRTFNGQFAELLIADFMKVAELAAADTALVAFWGTPV